ncbi:hypothetical protein KKG61_03600 [bacterium]|nr:hypothetical protein [bacterium]MBU1599174.1 hypothetical protein [bacterium]MBU2461939.1 hypothetical protein [bacterium]
MAGKYSSVGRLLSSQEAVIDSFWVGKYSLLPNIMICISFVAFAVLAYFITPKDEKEG